MSCVLRLGGSKEAVQRFVDRNFLVPIAIFEENINIDVSDAGFDDLQSQIEDAIAFLERNGEQLDEICQNFGIEAACLDFGVAQGDFFAQSFTFSSELLYLAGCFGIDIEVSLYSISDPEPNVAEAPPEPTP